jgi:hypothetical protein
VDDRAEPPPCAGGTAEQENRICTLKLSGVNHFRQSTMGRPAACPAHRKMAVDFASVVTRRSENPHDTIARSGTCSIFALFRFFRPAAVRLEFGGPRNGISEVEFNKELQVSRSYHLVLMNAINQNAISHEQILMITRPPNSFRTQTLPAPALLGQNLKRQPTKMRQHIHLTLKRCLTDFRQRR